MKKKILVHGTLDTLQKFFADAVSRDYEIVGVLSEENFLIQGLEVLAPKSVPPFVYKIIDAIIFTSTTNIRDFQFFIERGLPPRKIIPWDARQGWRSFSMTDKAGAQIIFFCGLEFHIRDDEDKKFFQSIYLRLQRQRLFKNINPKNYPAVLAQEFQLRTGKKLDFKNLRTLTEKMQWLKIFDATPLKTRLADKFLVRSWVAEKIGEQYLIPLLGVWNDFDDIDFDALPDQFVLKCNHGSGMNIIVRDKKNFDVTRAREKINALLAIDYASHCFELHYSKIKRKILAEKFFSNGDLPDIDNYKFWCFGRQLLFCGYDSGRTADGDLTNLRIDYFDMNWKPTEIENGSHPRSAHPEKIPRPKNFELMKKIAATLAEGFIFVRVDLYEIDGRVYFGEMTFIPGAGYFSYSSEGTDEYLGSLLKLPTIDPPRSFITERKKSIPRCELRRGIFFVIMQKKLEGTHDSDSRKNFGGADGRAIEIRAGLSERIPRGHVQPRHSHRLPNHQRRQKFFLRKIFSARTRRTFEHGDANAAE